MMWLDTLRWLHIIGAAVLLGTGAGIAFFMVMAHRTGDARIIAHVASTVVIAEFIFTAATVIAQPLTGIALVSETGRSLLDGWIALSLAFYLVAGAFWLPVVFIQVRLRDLARRAAAENRPLPALYHRLYTVWYAFGFPAFTSVLVIFWLMSAKPDIPMPWDH
jgi:uncharacterized membrane protein